MCTDYTWKLNNILIQEKDCSGKVVSSISFQYVTEELSNTDTSSSKKIVLYELILLFLLTLNCTNIHGLN